MERVRIPRGFSVAIVYLTFAAALVVVVLALGVIVVDQTKTAADRFDDYLRPRADRLRRPGPSATSTGCSSGSTRTTSNGSRSARQGQDFAENIKGKDVGKYTSEAIDFLEGAAISIGKLLFNLVLVLVISIYMLLDMPRLKRRGRPALPAAAGAPGADPANREALAGYVRGQVLLSLIIGASAGVGHLHPRRRSACCRTATSTRSSSAPGSR